MAESIIVDKQASYAVITLNRPKKRNALSIDLLMNLQAAMEAVKSECRVVILTGAGDRAFSAGLDLTELDAHNKGRRFAHGSSLFFETLEAMRRHPAIFIAAVNGFALGGGLTLTHNSELAIAAEHARFGMPEIELGLFPALAGPSTIHRILPKRASWLILTGERVDAATAERWGIVNEVVPSDGLMARAVELAQRLSRVDAVTLDYTKKALRDIATLEWSRAIDYGLDLGHLISRQTTADGVSRSLTDDRGQRADE
jgi:enoyl-CoA hydratase/carnithine racemase